MKFQYNDSEIQRKPFSFLPIPMEQNETDKNKGGKQEAQDSCCGKYSEPAGSRLGWNTRLTSGGPAFGF